MPLQSGSGDMSEEVIREEAVELNFHLPNCEGIEPCEPVIFNAVKVDKNKIIIKQIEECSGEHIFCNYLKNEEVDLFFDNIDVETMVMDNSTFGTHYQYGMNPISEHVKVMFNVHENINGVDTEINFCDGMWFTTMDNEGVVGDVAELDRDSYIKSYIAQALQPVDPKYYKFKKSRPADRIDFDKHISNKLWIDIQDYGKKHGQISRNDVLAIISPFIDGRDLRDLIADEFIKMLLKEGFK